MAPHTQEGMKYKTGKIRTSGGRIARSTCRGTLVSCATAQDNEGAGDCSMYRQTAVDDLNDSVIDEVNKNGKDSDCELRQVTDMKGLQCLLTMLTCKLMQSDYDRLDALNGPSMHQRNQSGRLKCYWWGERLKNVKYANLICYYISHCRVWQAQLCRGLR